MGDREIDRSIGTALRAQRRRAGLTVSALAELAGVSQPHLSQMENGKTSPSINALYRIATALEITPQELLPPIRSGVATVMRRDTMPLVPLVEDPGAASARILLGGAGRGLQVQEILVSEGEHLGGWFSHEGEELVIVAEGRLTVELEGDDPVTLEHGDAMSYPSEVAHTWRTEPPLPARILAIAASATDGIRRHHLAEDVKAPPSRVSP